MKISWLLLEQISVVLIATNKLDQRQEHQSSLAHSVIIISLTQVVIIQDRGC